MGGSDSGDDASSLKKTKTKKKVKDPNAPKRNMSAFMFFSNEMRASVNEANPGIGMTEVSKELGKLWKELSEDDRKVKGRCVKLVGSLLTFPPILFYRPFL